MVARRVGDRAAQAQAHDDLGAGYCLQGRYDEALACHQESLAIFRERGDREGQAYNLNGLGVVYQLQGRHDRALACLRNSIAIRRELGDPYGEAESLRNLGVVLRALDRLQEARAHWLEALVIFERLRTADADQVRLLLADLPAQPPGPHAQPVADQVEAGDG